MELTPRDIQDKQFHDAFRGYSHEEVDAFLDEVALAFDKVHGDNQELERRVAELEQGAVEGGVAAEMLRKTIYSAQRTASEAIDEAQSTASRLLADAQEKARDAVVAAEASAREVVAAAEAQAREAIAGAEVRAGDIVARALATERELETRIEGLRTFEETYRARLVAFFESQLRALSETPVVEAPPDIAPVLVREEPDVATAQVASVPQDAVQGEASSEQAGTAAGTLVMTWPEEPSPAEREMPAPATDDEAVDETVDETVQAAPEPSGLRVVTRPARVRSAPAQPASRPEPGGPPPGPNRRHDTRPPARTSADGVDEEEHRSITRLFWGGDE